MTQTTSPPVNDTGRMPPHESAPRELSKILYAFFIMYKTARMVDPKNDGFKNQMNSFLKAFELVSTDSGDITIKSVTDRFFVNETMVPFDEEKLSGVAKVLSEWRQLGMGGVTFEAAITTDELSRFFVFIANMKPTNENIDTLIEQLRKDDLPNVRLLSTKELLPDRIEVNQEARRRFRTMARKTFFQAVNVVQEVMVNAAEDKDINISKTKRVVHSLLDQVTRDESSLLELTAIKNFDDYTYAHSTNVCVYSLTIGVRLGLDRARLSQLGFAALFHDIGKVKLPSDLIKKPGAFDEDDWVQMQRHPVLGAKTILRNLKFDMHVARAARAAFEHHINNDFTGYPLLRYQRRPQTLFSKIVSVVDTFDALTAGRVYLKKALSPDVVFKKMRYQMKVKFDPFLLKLFNDIVGTYPAGSLVLLTTDELALVLTNNEQNKARPSVKIIGNKEGLFEKAEWVDLISPDQQHRSVVRMIEPSRYGLDIKDFVLKD